MILNSSLVVHKARVVDSVGFLENGTIIVSVSRNEINVHNAGRLANVALPDQN